jgi:hypothetical protein
MTKILCLTFVLFASVNVFAQEKTIQRAEFETITRSSSRLMAGKPRRIIRTQQSTVEIAPQTNVSNASAKSLPPSTILVKSVTEVLPEVGFRSIYEFNSSSKNIKKEIIKVAGKTYTREGNGEWTETFSEITSKRESAARNIVNQVEYKSFGSDRLGNQNTSIYAKIERSKFTNPSDNRESISSTTTKYWYGEDGRLLKRERTREIRNGKMISKFNSTTVFELDPNIKIEAPKLN